MLLVVGENSSIGKAVMRLARLRNLPAESTSRNFNSRFCIDLGAPPDEWRFPRKIDHAILCAARTGLTECEENPQGTYAVNVSATCTLADVLASHGAKIAFLSSNQVFNSAQATPDEAATPDPVNEYGRQKLAVEQHLRAHVPNSRIIRLTKVISPRVPLLGAWRNNLEQGIPISAFANLYLSPLCLDFVADAIFQILACNEDGIFHLSSSDSLSYLDVANWMAKRLHVGPELVRRAEAPTPNTPESCRLQCSRTRRLTGCSPLPAIANLSQSYDAIDASAKPR